MTMRDPSATSSTLPFALVCLLAFGGRSVRGEELQRLDGARLVEHAANDGDSFHVKAGERDLVVRLYFVDCCETEASTDSDARRVREQMRYFGLPDAPRTLHFGSVAKAVTAKVLSQPFTVHTAFARALGRSATPRVYAMVTTAAGEDLASLLVKSGLARARGVGREMPDGTSRDEQTERLCDMQDAAMLKRVGVWAEANPERLAELRAAERAEERELDAFMGRQAAPVAAGTAPQPLDVNRATREQLAAIPGMRTEWIDAIIAGRPHARIEDLLRVKGIGPKTLEKLRPYVMIADPR